MTNPGAEMPDDGLLGTSEKTSITDRTVGRQCEWCGDWVPYSGSGRPSKYCSPAHKQRDYEVRTAERRRDRDAALGKVRDHPVRELVERTETVTRTVVREALPWSSGPLRVPSNAGEWARMLGTLAKLLPRGHLQKQPEWAEVEAAVRRLGALLEEHPARQAAPPAAPPALSDENDFLLPPPRKPVEPSAKKRPRRKRRKR